MKFEKYLGDITTRIDDLITEMSMKSVRIEDIVTKKYIDRELDTPDLEGYLYDYKIRELGYDWSGMEDDDLPDDEEIMESPEFMEFIQSELEDRFYDIQDSISRITKGGYITIFREMTVRADWEKNLRKHKRLGVYWSWDEHAAEAHWGKFIKDYKKILLVSRVKERHVDWIDTFQLNINPSLGEMEQEIRLFKNTPIKIERLYIRGKEVDISEIKDKVYKA